MRARRRTRSSTLASAGWLAVAGVASAACVALARAVARGETGGVDVRLRRGAIPLAAPPIRALATVTGPLGKWHAYVPFALVVAGALVAAHRPRPAAVAALGSAFAARLASEVIERVTPHHAPPPGRGDPRVQSFPSGHTLEPLAVGLVTAVVLAREGLPRPGLTGVAIGAPVLGALGRLVLDRHWPSDVVGGALAGLAVAGVCLAGYEAARAA